MTTITLGRWQAAALVASALVLVVLAVALGFLLALTMVGGPAGPMVASAPAAAASAQDPARGQGDGLVANARRRVFDSYEMNSAIRGTADHVSDAAGAGAEMVVDPLANGVGAAAGRFLPGWMAGPLMAASQRAAYRAKQKVLFSTEDAVEDTLGDAAQRIGEGSAAPPRRYAIELGRFATPVNAEAFAAAAAQRGVACTVDYAPEPGQTSAYAVRTGRYAAAEEASSALDALTRSSGITGTVVALAEPGGRANP
ncbi:MAG TPA: SPOR domain-containing protein [Azospirillum sp.]|nr:SPOR domain-containing protein [Azospirillum sp.]